MAVSRRRACATWPIVLAMLMVLPVGAGAPPRDGRSEPGPQSETLGTFLRRAPSLPPAYRAVRHLEASNQRSRTEGRLEAITSFTPTEGFRYEVVAEQGAGIVRNRVLRAVLDAEAAALRDHPRANALIEDNYRITDTGEIVDGLVKLRLVPRRKSQLLIDGFAFVTPGTARLVRLEGRLARNPSFWTTRVDVVRRYEVLNGFDMAVELSSQACIRMFGESQFRMSIRYETVAGESAAAAQSD